MSVIFYVIVGFFVLFFIFFLINIIRVIKFQNDVFGKNPNMDNNVMANAMNNSINVLDSVTKANEEKLTDISNRNARIKKESVKVTARAVREGLLEESVYCKYCGKLIDVDSKFCKVCGKEQ